MAVYGSVLESYQTERISFEDFMDICYESEYQLDSIMREYYLTNINEQDETALAPQFKFEFKEDQNTEQVKKTIIQKIKELLGRFYKFVKDSFDSLVEKLNKFYMETNFTDKFISKFSSNVTWDNMQKAIKGGWKGLSIKQPMIFRLVSVRDSDLFTSIEDSFEYDEETDGSKRNIDKVELDVQRDIDPIITSADKDEAQENYDKFKEKLVKFRKMGIRKESLYSFTDNILNKADNGVENYILGIFNNTNADDGYYYPPDRKIFELNKNFAETGQKQIKEISANYKTSLKNIKYLNKGNLTNMKSYTGKGSNKTDNEEVNKINYLYCKAKYEYGIAIIQRCSKIIRTVVTILKMQHKYAISFYMTVNSAVQKYAK